MAISSINTTTGQTITQEEYLQILAAQLQNQDPLEPTSDTEFISQLTQFSSLQGINQLNASFASVLQLQQLTSGASLIGKTVTFGANGQTQSGRVDRLDVQDGGIVLQIGSNRVALGDIQSIQ